MPTHKMTSTYSIGERGGHFRLSVALALTDRTTDFPRLQPTPSAAMGRSGGDDADAPPQHNIGGFARAAAEARTKARFLWAMQSSKGGSVADAGLSPFTILERDAAAAVEGRIARAQRKKARSSKVAPEPPEAEVMEDRGVGELDTAMELEHLRETHSPGGCGCRGSPCAGQIGRSEHVIVKDQAGARAVAIRAPGRMERSDTAHWSGVIQSGAFLTLSSKRYRAQADAVPRPRNSHDKADANTCLRCVEFDTYENAAFSKVGSQILTVP